MSGASRGSRRPTGARRRLHKAERLSEGFIERIGSWRSSGFSVYGEQVVFPHETERLERLARYITRPPIAVASVSRHADGRVHVTTPPDPKTGATDVLLDPLDWIHAITSQIPDPRLHLTRAYGAFANKLRRSRLPQKTQLHEQHSSEDDPPFLKARKASWARLIRRLSRPTGPARATPSTSEPHRPRRPRPPLPCPTRTVTPHVL